MNLLIAAGFPALSSTTSALGRRTSAGAPLAGRYSVATVEPITCSGGTP